MTCWVILQLLDKFGLNAKKIKIKVLRSSTSEVLGGTSANLIKGDSFTVFELLHGMMLPSGNDAAQTLAIYFGNLINQI